MVKQRHQLFVALLSIADGAVVVAACYLAWAVRRLLADGNFPGEWVTWVREPLWIFVVPLALAAMWTFRLYVPRRDRSAWSEQAQIVKASVATVMALIALLWAVGSNVVLATEKAPTATVLGYTTDANRLQLALLALALPTVVGAHRIAFRLALRTLRRRGRNLRHVAVIGVGRLGQVACRTLERNAWTGIHVAYFLSHHERTKRETCLGRPVLGGLADLERVMETDKPDAVYLCVPTQRAAHIPGILKRLERFAVDVRIIPDVQPRYLPQSMTVSELDGMPILSYRESPVYGLGGFSKRLLDLAGGLAAMVIFAPLMGACALAVRASGPGPVIFKQRRVSLGGEEFNIYKFRTMYHAEDEQGALAVVGADAGGREGDLVRSRDAGGAGVDADARAQWTARNDPRVTPVGRWMRRTSLDELPQLLNVLRGEMSLVGPRPERPELIEKFREDWRGYMLRQHVKAGMTGWAQVQGYRGDTCLRKRLQHDLFYIRHWSLGFDVKILLMTVVRGFVHRNAH